MSARAASAAGQPVFLILKGLGASRLQLSSPLTVEAHWDPDGVTVHHPPSDVFGYGESEAEALDDFRKALVELYFTLDAERGALGPALQRTLEVLDAVLRVSDPGGLSSDPA